jgi:hypothetical protein
MSIFNDKTLKSVADAVADVMREELKGNQHKIDANKNNKIDAHDFKILRGEKKAPFEGGKEKPETVTDKSGAKHGPMSKARDLARRALRKEDVEQIDELSKDTLKSYQQKASAHVDKHLGLGNFGRSKPADNDLKSISKVANRAAGYVKAGEKLRKEETEQVDEAISTKSMSHQAKTTIKHVDNPGVQDRMDAHDIKPGISGYRDRIDYLKRMKQMGKLKNEEVEELEEGWAEMEAAHKEREKAKGTGNFDKRKVSTGTVYTRKAAEQNDDEDAEKSHKKQKLGSSSDLMSDEEFKRKHGMSRKNYERMQSGVKIGESFTEMLEAYNENGLKAFASLQEEPDNEQFTKELKRQERKAAGTAPESEKAQVAKGDVKAVKEDDKHGTAIVKEEYKCKHPKDETCSKCDMKEEYDLYEAKEIEGLHIQTPNDEHHVIKGVKNTRENAEKIHDKVINAAAKKANVHWADMHRAAEKSDHYHGHIDAIDRDNPNLRKVHKVHDSVADYVNHHAKIAAAELKPKTGMKEETEQLDEISKKTLGNYIKKSSHDVATKGAIVRQFSNDAEAKRKEHGGTTQAVRELSAKADKVFNKSWKRREGMAKAVDRLTKEEAELDEAAKWRQGYRASGHPAGFKHKSGEVGPLGGTYDTENQYGDEKKVPVQKHRDYEDPLKNREKTKLSTSGKPLLSKNAQKNLKTAIQQAKGKHGPVSKLPEEVELDERTLSKSEMEKKEDYVKGMKKKLSGFKQRYGERAKEVMYATATKMAKGDKE